MRHVGPATHIDRLAPPRRNRVRVLHETSHGGVFVEYVDDQGDRYPHTRPVAISRKHIVPIGDE